MMLMSCSGPIHAQAAQPHLSPDQIAAAKDWLCDCSWADVEDDDIRRKSDLQIEQAIIRHYDGGISAFVRDGQP